MTKDAYLLASEALPIMKASLAGHPEALKKAQEALYAAYPDVVAEYLEYDAQHKFPGPETGGDHNSGSAKPDPKMTYETGERPGIQSHPRNYQPNTVAEAAMEGTVGSNGEDNSEKSPKHLKAALSIHKAFYGRPAPMPPDLAPLRLLKRLAVQAGDNVDKIEVNPRPMESQPDNPTTGITGANNPETSGKAGEKPAAVKKWTGEPIDPNPAGTAERTAILKESLTEGAIKDHGRIAKADFCGKCDLRKSLTPRKGGCTCTQA